MSATTGNNSPTTSGNSSPTISELMVKLGLDGDDTPQPVKRRRFDRYWGLYITGGASPKNNNNECPICQDVLADTDECLEHTECELSFCYDCLLTWLEGAHFSCPICRGPIYYEDGWPRGRRPYPTESDYVSPCSDSEWERYLDELPEPMRDVPDPDPYESEFYDSEFSVSDFDESESGSDGSEYDSGYDASGEGSDTDESESQWESDWDSRQPGAEVSESEEDNIYTSLYPSDTDESDSQWESDRDSDQPGSEGSESADDDIYTSLEEFDQLMKAQYLWW